MLMRWKFAWCVVVLSMSLSCFAEGEKVTGPALVPQPPKPGLGAEEDSLPPAPIPSEEKKNRLPDPPLPREFSVPQTKKTESSAPVRPGNYAIPLDEPVQPAFPPLNTTEETQSSTRTGTAVNDQDFATIANSDQVFDLYDRMRNSRQKRPFCDGMGHTITAAKLVSCIGANDNAVRYQLLLAMIEAMSQASDVRLAKVTQLFQCAPRISRIAAELVCRQGERPAAEMISRLVLSFNWLTQKVDGRSNWSADYLHNWEAAAQLVQ